MGGHNAIIEGNSFSTIQWGSVEVSLKIGRLVEEVLQVSAHSEYSFHHILCGANETADGLAGEGATS